MSMMTGAPTRASDAERDQAVRFLTKHTAQGRLTLDELQDRTAAAYAATTRNQLQALAQDLPGALVFGRDEGEPAAGARRTPDRTPPWRIRLTCCCVPTTLLTLGRPDV